MLFLHFCLRIFEYIRTLFLLPFLALFYCVFIAGDFCLFLLVPIFAGAPMLSFSVLALPGRSLGGTSYGVRLFLRERLREFSIKCSNFPILARRGKSPNIYVLVR